MFCERVSSSSRGMDKASMNCTQTINDPGGISESYLEAQNRLTMATSSGCRSCAGSLSSDTKKKSCLPRSKSIEELLEKYAPSSVRDTDYAGVSDQRERTVDVAWQQSKDLDHMDESHIRLSDQTNGAREQHQDSAAPIRTSTYTSQLSWTPSIQPASMATLSKLNLTEHNKGNNISLQYVTAPPNPFPEYKNPQAAKYDHHSSSGDNNVPRKFSLQDSTNTDVWLPHSSPPGLPDYMKPKPYGDSNNFSQTHSQEQTMHISSAKLSNLRLGGPDTADQDFDQFYRETENKHSLCHSPSQVRRCPSISPDPTQAPCFVIEKEEESDSTLQPRLIHKFSPLNMILSSTAPHSSNRHHSEVCSFTNNYGCSRKSSSADSAIDVKSPTPYDISPESYSLPFSYPSDYPRTLRAANTDEVLKSWPDSSTDVYLPRSEEIECSTEPEGEDHNLGTQSLDTRRQRSPQIPSRISFSMVQTPSFTKLSDPPAVVISDHSHEIPLPMPLSTPQNILAYISSEVTDNLDIERPVCERKLSTSSIASDSSRSACSLLSDSSYSIEDDDVDYTPNTDRCFNMRPKVS